MASVILRLPGAEIKSVVHGMKKKERKLCLTLSCCPAAACPLPMSCASQGWAVGLQGCRSVPQPEAPAVSSCLPAFAGTVPWQICGWWNRSVLYHTNVPWVCGADAAWHWLAEFWLSPAQGGSPLRFCFPLSVSLSCAAEC